MRQRRCTTPRMTEEEKEYDGFAQWLRTKRRKLILNGTVVTQATYAAKLRSTGRTRIASEEVAADSWVTENNRHEALKVITGFAVQPAKRPIG